MTTDSVDKQAFHEELDRVRSEFHQLLAEAGPEDLRRRSRGTKWTNEQLLFHMLFGYLIVRALLLVMSVVVRLPTPAGRGLAKTLNVSRRPFDAINYWGSVVGAKVINHRRMGHRLDRVIDSLHRHLDRDSEKALRRSMPYPNHWDPFFAEVMTRADLYHYGTQPFDFHAKQLSFGAGTAAEPSSH